MNFNRYYADFQQYLLETDHSHGTIKGYLGNLKAFERWMVNRPDATAPISLADITPLDVRNYRDDMLHTRKLKPATINRSLAGLRVYLSFLVEKKLLAHNPAAKIREVKRVPPTPRWLSPAEQQTLRRAFDHMVRLTDGDFGASSPYTIMAIRDRALFLLLLNTGMRAAELIQLTLDDLELTDRRGAVFIRNGKGGKSRTIPLNRDVRRALNEYLDVRPRADTRRLFLGERGPIGARQLLRILKKYAKFAGMKPTLVTVHTLRHTFGKNLVNAGVPLDRVATLLGHANLNTTRIYTTPDENDLQRAVEQLVK